MIPENELLFACTRQAFLEKHRKAVIDVCNSTEIGWDVVFSTSQLHGVAPLVYLNLLQCTTADVKIPRQTMEKFKLCYYRNTAIKEEMAERIRRALDFFHKKQIDVMLVKGAALDLLVYDQPAYTISDDVDLVVRCKKEDLSERDITEIGHFLYRTGIEYDYFSHHDIDHNGVLPIDFESIWGDAIRMQLEGLCVFLMSPEDMLISTCTNSARKRFFRLKCLCDIAEIVHRREDLKWEELIKKARKYDCSSLVYAALLATQTILGCDLPDGVLQDLAVDPARAKIIRALVSYASQHMPLSSVHVYTDEDVFNRRVTMPLILKYITYRPYQVWRMTKRLYRGLQN